ncbi:hypothetical protein EPUS_00469 [Endocarpon pusillum Z07020]|uniref:Uncharacterized protein n=1 Tax=Endocarpon pusillum (strain Z07020 / HMAS-L-300199) TaxID=1263415 RepID=U1HME3_ENDPU|nr:uncharacterized protein EPUS_00469 [Endocarpon pusillum Z07020]ERF71480.1 hypothetical protein EPUS_00469 [Endocarpon pusillum Z07020]
MSDLPSNASTHRFRVKAGINRKNPEQRAAAIQAEALRLANQIQPQASPAQQDAARRTASTQRDARVKTQNTASVFGSGAGATSSKSKNAHAVSGTEELIQGAEGGESVSLERERLGKARAVASNEEKPISANQKKSGRQAKTTAKKEDAIYFSDGDVEGQEGKPVDIEDIDRISISSDGDEEVDDDIVLSRRRRVNKTPKPTLGLRPVRAVRDTHVRDDTENEAYTKVRRKAKGIDPQKADKDHGDTMDVDEEDENIAVTAEQTTPPLADKSNLPSQSPTKRRRKSSTKGLKPEFETIEERAERARYASDLRRLKNELAPGTHEHHQGDEKSHEAAPLSDPREGGLYLFQFPPLTPMLINPSQPPKQPEIKSEPTTTFTEPNAPASASAPAPAEPQVKKEDGADTKTPLTTTSATEPERPPLLTACNPSSLPAGLAGKLHVHQSGKVTLEWGHGGHTNEATNLEVKWGAEVDFLQDVVLLASSSSPSSAAGGGGGGGDGGDQSVSGGFDGGKKAWALSQVRNKFVVVPDWGRIYE